MADAEKQLLLNKKPFVNTVDKFGWLQNHLFMVVSSIGLSICITALALSHRPRHSIWDDLTDGMPKRGELGFGKFLIFGTTIPFKYPFRLAFPSLPAKLTPWLCYFPHQFGQFYIIYKAKQAKEARGDIDWTDGGRWNKYAWRMLLLNLTFIAIHILQTHLFYDGLAGTFSEIATLFAGVSSIMIAFMFEIRRRNLFFAWTPKAGREILFEFAAFVKKYHGYLSSFGMTLTFWYHTMEATFAHTTGFVHIFLLLWQSSLIYQRAHRNRYWTGLLEMWIVLHGSVVAYYQGILGGVLFLMFLTSFILLFQMSTVWGLPIIQKFLASKETRKERVWIIRIVMLAWFVPFSVFMFWQYNALA